MKKNAVVLFNLGGPDSLKAVKPFLFNLFNDPAIMRLPQPFRWCVASLISNLRAAKARKMYQHMGGRSPILDMTAAQAEALEQQLNSQERNKEQEYRIFICMRHWNPMSSLVVKNVKAYAPDHILLLPLYPQYSTTTTASSFADWTNTCQKEKLSVPTTSICCYAGDLGFIAAHAKLIRDAYWKASENGKPRVLFSAHGLPEKIIAGGDPYQWQVEKTVDAVIQILAIEDLDYVTCYQSRVGPVPWIKPSTDKEIIQAGEDKVPLVVVPISFVSEHSETLVELDIDYKNLAELYGVPAYYRVPALGTEENFIEALAGLCINAERSEDIRSFTKTRFCSRNFEKCPCAA